MKKLLTLFAIALAVMVSSCSKFDDGAIWEKFDEQEQILNDHEKRIAALEELCKQMNTNINALQTLVEALEKRDYITNVSPVRKDGEVIGYTISFANSDTITIYHGENGQDGADGKDGYTPQIGVMKDTDGIYYWTIDGEWLLDGKGNKIKAIGVDGENGKDGTNGVDGIDGITPRLKIENDYWYVSYDEGATWIELGRATGEDGADGSDGTDGSDGDSIFSSVTQDDEYVYFNLADGTMITLPKHDKENIQFEDLRVKAICCKNWDTNNDGELSYAEAAAVTDIGLAFSGNANIIAFTEFKYFTSITELQSAAFYNCVNLWKIVLPESLILIHNPNLNNSNSDVRHKGAFAKTAITHITLPETLTTIPAAAFYQCKKLKSVSLGNNISSIGEYAFYDCSLLADIHLSDPLISIGQNAFSCCSNLTMITIPSGVSELGDCIFTSCDLLMTVYCMPINPPKCVRAGQWFGESSVLSDIKIYVPMESVGNYKAADGWDDYANIIYGYDFE